jgi:glycosyltransferase involved in cell wall biosynthesis
MSAAVVVDTAGAKMGGAARFKSELDSYLVRSGRDDVKVIGTGRHVNAAWLLAREANSARSRRVAINNVSFVGPGGARWTLLRNPLDFLTEEEESKISLSRRPHIWRRAPVVRLAARRADVVVTPTTEMAERVTRILPGLQNRVVIRPHPVSADSVPTIQPDQIILCPVLFSPYKGMATRIEKWLAATDGHIDPSLRLVVTATQAEVPQSLARNPRLQLIGRIDHSDLRRLWASARAIYFPTRIESFGYPLAEARVNGQPVIALDTPLNREVAGNALCSFTPGDTASLLQATEVTLAADIEPDPSPFNPDAYFSWLLGAPQ